MCLNNNFLPFFKKLDKTVLRIFVYDFSIIYYLVLNVNKNKNLYVQYKICLRNTIYEITFPRYSVHYAL